MSHQPNQNAVFKRGCFRLKETFGNKIKEIAREGLLPSAKSETSRDSRKRGRASGTRLAVTWCVRVKTVLFSKRHPNIFRNEIRHCLRFTQKCCGKGENRASRCEGRSGDRGPCSFLCSERFLRTFGQDVGLRGRPSTEASGTPHLALRSSSQLLQTHT